MEKEISKREKLLLLLKTATNPFSSDEKITDVLNIFKNSSNFDGLNHLILIDDYFKDDSIFFLTKDEAILEAKKAVSENNKIGYYYLYLLYLDKDKKYALDCLLKIIDSSFPRADLAYAEHLYNGDIIKKDEKLAFKYYQNAAKYNFKEGYYGMMLILEKNHHYEEANQVYNEAKKKGIELPGVVI